MIVCHRRTVGVKESLHISRCIIEVVILLAVVFHCEAGAVGVIVEPPNICTVGLAYEFTVCILRSSQL